MKNIIENINRISAIPAAYTEENKDLFTRPFVVTGHMRQYPAFEKWTPDFFAQHCGDFVHKVTSARHETKDMTVAEYMKYLVAAADDGHYLYLKDWQFEHKFPEFMDDYWTPDVFKSWIAFAPPGAQIVLRWLYIGVKGSGSALHVDVLDTSAWNGVVSGKKLWLFYPPEQKKYIYGLKLDAFRSDFQDFPLIRETGAICCVQNEGDLVYTPSRWPHQVINLESGISITENFVNSTNYAEVNAFLKSNGQTNLIAVLEQLRRMNLPY